MDQNEVRFSTAFQKVTWVCIRVCVILLQSCIFQNTRIFQNIDVYLSIDTPI